MFRCNLPPALLAGWPGSFTCYCGNTGAPNKSQHTELTLEKKIIPPLLLGFELATFRSRVRRSYREAISTPLLANEYKVDKFYRGRVCMTLNFADVSSSLTRLYWLSVCSSGPLQTARILIEFYPKFCCIDCVITQTALPATLSFPWRINGQNFCERND